MKTLFLRFRGLLKKKNPKKQVCITYLNSLYDSDKPYHDLGRWNIQQAFPK